MNAVCISPQPCRQKFDLKWEVGWTSEPEAAPARCVEAQVPGAVQLDWAKAEGFSDYWKADSWRDYLWMEDVFWLYRTRLEIPVKQNGDQLFLVLRGVDYRFEVRLAGKTLVAQEGMFSPVELDLTDVANNGDELSILVYPAPKSKAQPTDRSQADRSCKPAVSYGWDFHPRLIPLGIWDEVYLETRPELRLVRCEVDYTLADDFSSVNANLQVHTSHSAEGLVAWMICDGEGNVKVEQQATVKNGICNIDAVLLQPELWWPHDHGKSELYLSRVELRGDGGAIADIREQRIGFRRVRMVMHEGAWDSPSVFPKSRSTPPMTLEINGRAIFAKGANCVSPEIFPGLLNRETWESQLRLAKESNMNLLRMWGGAVVQKDSFFDLCDEMGIMVWQEFPLACNNYQDDPHYLDVLDRESGSIISRLKHHPCLALWCGGNELFNAWSGMTDQSLALRLLNRNCFDLDPKRPFIMTSPLDGVGHGHYVFRDPETGEEAWQIFQEASNTAYCEFGCPSPASREVLESIIPPEDLFPPKTGTAWETHHAFGVWMSSSHLYLDVLEYYFGKIDSLDRLVELGQMLQAEGYKGLFEESRRQKPRSSMALNWCLNEPWPTAANNSLISWPCIPKPAMQAVGQSCRPMLASARIRQFQWREGELFDPELWFLSDLYEAWPGGQMKAEIRTEKETISLMEWNVPALKLNCNCKGPRVAFELPDLGTALFELILSLKGMPELSSSYTLAFVSGRVKKRNPRSMN